MATKEKSGGNGWTMMQKLKMGGTALVAILMVIIVLQNTEPVETRLLFATITMPRAVLLFVTLVVGVLIGLLIPRFRKKRR